MKEELKNPIETNQLIEIAERQRIDLGKNPKRTLTFWCQQGLIPNPTEKAEGAFHEKKSFYPLFTLLLIQNIRRLQSQGKSIDEIKNDFNQAMLIAKRRQLGSEPILREYGLDKKRIKAINIVFRLETETQDLKKRLEEQEILIRKYLGKPKAKVSFWNINRCILCNRALIGRGTKDIYEIADVKRVIPSLAIEYEKDNPFGVYACRSIRKCGVPDLLYRLKLQAGKYLYGYRITR